jgi:exopolysaccharide biosynthesis polyprenyl glycosylphosphotransferase
MVSRGTASRRRMVATKSGAEPRPADGAVAAADGAVEGAPTVAARRVRTRGTLRLAVDLVSLAAAALLVELFWSEGGFDRILWPALFAAGVLYLSYVRRGYSRRTTLDSVDDIRSTVAVVGLAVGLVVTLQVLVEGSSTDLIDTVRLGAIAAVAVAVGRVAADFWAFRARRHGNDLVPTLIVGAGQIGRRTARRLVEHPELGLKPVGFLDKEPLAEVDETTGLPVLGASWDLDDVAERYGIGHVIVTFSTAPTEVLLRIVNSCERHGITVALVPRLFEKVTERLTIEHIGGLPLITSHPSDPRGWQFAIKYGLDRICAFLLLLVLSPVLGACAIAVWISLGRPILFRQRRVGCDGREFEMLKFRSLKPNAAHLEEALDLPDEDTAPGGTGSGGRVTKVGAFLRNTSLDELPQLLNVLKGEMSIVGPRPERPEFVELFEPRVYRYYDRHRVKAGITGWAQVNGLRGQTSLSDRVEWDNYYIENFSLWLDLKIVGKTIVTLPRHSKTCR